MANYKSSNKQYWLYAALKKNKAKNNYLHVL